MNKAKSIILSVLGVIATAMFAFMVWKHFNEYAPQILFVLWRIYFNYVTYFRGIKLNKMISWWKVSGVIFAVAVFETVLTIVLYWGGFYH